MYFKNKKVTVIHAAKFSNCITVFLCAEMWNDRSPFLRVLDREYYPCGLRFKKGLFYGCFKRSIIPLYTSVCADSLLFVCGGQFFCNRDSILIYSLYTDNICRIPNTALSSAASSARYTTLYQQAIPPP